MAAFRSLFALLAILAIKVLGDCVSYGVDYANGGSYVIDGSSNQYFTFVTVFEGCDNETINPDLVGPDGTQYACSSITTQPDDTEETSTCGIPLSAMSSGQWKIIISGNQVQVQRTLTLTVGIVTTSTVVATPTIVLGVTTTPKASTVIRTIRQTESLILVPNTVTAACNGGTQTVTAIPHSGTIIITSTIIRTATDAATTNYYTTTLSASASCHLSKRDVVDRRARVADVTVTTTETTYTVTRTLVSTVHASTTTEDVMQTITATVTPPASTVCNGQGSPAVTVTVQPHNVGTHTQTDIAYSTIQQAGTVLVGQTQYTTFTNSASATACWQAGGWYGA